jgi:hypothetical protein
LDAYRVIGEMIFCFEVYKAKSPESILSFIKRTRQCFFAHLTCQNIRQ